MKFTPTRLAEVVLIEPMVFTDERGSFMETWEARKFAAAGIEARFVQDNHSFSRQWVLRGLHYQERHAQGKIVRVVQGEVFDVAVDVRRSSPTFGEWVGMHLSARNRHMMWIPPGFAHGFLALTDDVEFVYKCTDYYDRTSERAIVWDDPELAIDWPLPLHVAPIVSAKDAAAPTLTAAECMA
jgi:dTDP-4-dehydrorhamnose 3,5-epimerase